MFRDLFEAMNETKSLERRTRLAIFKWTTKVSQYSALLLVMSFFAGWRFAQRTGDVDLLHVRTAGVAFVLYVGPALLLLWFLLPVWKARSVVKRTLSAEDTEQISKEAMWVYVTVVVLICLAWGAVTLFSQM